MAGQKSSVTCFFKDSKLKRYIKLEPRLFGVFLSEPSEFSSGQCPGNLFCVREKGEGEFDESLPPAGKKGEAGCRQHPPAPISSTSALCWVHGQWPGPENPLEIFRRIIFFHIHIQEKRRKTNNLLNCSLWRNPIPVLHERSLSLSDHAD